MEIIVGLLASLLTSDLKLLRPGGAKSLVAENLLLKEQLLILTRSRQRAPNFSSTHRVVLAFLSLFLTRRRIAKVVVCLKPSILLTFHHWLVHRKYQRLFSPRTRRKPGPKGP